MDLRFNPDDLDLGDLEDFEEVVGKTLDDILRPVPVLDEDGNKTFDEKGRPVSTVKISAKALTTLVWLIRRKSDPGFTRDDARAVKVGQLVIEESTTADRGND